MRPLTPRRSPVTLAVVVAALLPWSLISPLSAQSSGEPSAVATVSKASLDNRTAALSIPALPVDDPAYRTLVSRTSDDPVRIAQLETDAGIEIGTVTLELEEPDAQEELETARYDLWLARAAGNDTWSLLVDRAGGASASGPSDVIGTLGLSHQSAEIASTNLTGGIVATGSDTGRLIFGWGEHAWATQIRFTTPRERPRSRRESGVGDTRTFEFDSSPLQRASRLATRNILTVTRPDGSRLGTVYPKQLTVDTRDFAHLVSVETDAVVQLTGGAVIRLDLGVPLVFGDVMVEPGNVGLSSEPGAYGLWLRRRADGWTLVFNDEPDAWGTQHDPELDVAEIALAYRQTDDSSRALSASVVMTTPDRGQFVLVWGPHEWTADFVVSG